MMETKQPAMQRSSARERALETASSLFYTHGVRAVGMEQIVDISGIAKTTIYRHFPTKDALIAAYLEREDQIFWRQWDEVVDGKQGIATLDALCDWIGDRVSRHGYRGCPQINVASEFANPDHPARKVAQSHKSEMLRRLTRLCAEMGVHDEASVALSLALLFDGAFMSGGRLAEHDAAQLLKQAAQRLAGV